MSTKTLRPSLIRPFAIAFLALYLVASALAVTRTENTVTITDPKSTTLKITTTVHGVNQPQLEIGLPNWAPGYYSTEDYVRNTARMTFTDQTGRRLYHRKNHDSLWILDTRGAATVTIQFEYTANRLNLNQSIVTPTWALLNGVNFLIYVKDHTLDIPASVKYELPAGWRIATGLTPTGDPTTFTAEHYDFLVDCPTIVGDFDLVTLPLRGVPHHWVVAPKDALSTDGLKRLAEESIKIYDAHIQMFGEMPYKQYLTMFILGDRAIGGLEHLNSHLNIMKKPQTPEGALGFLGLMSHEFFHLFNVKRIRPAEMWPYKYHERNYSPLLWVSEGVTNYYTSRGLLRAGRLKPDAYLSNQAQTLGQVEAVEAARYISLEESSINTWVGGFIGAGQPFAVNYYARGHTIGLLLDLSIRHDTKGSATLDDVMRALYNDFYKKDRGFTTSDLIEVINHLTGKDYSQFFHNYVSGTERLPYDQVLGYAGLRLQETKERAPRVGVFMDDDHRITGFAPESAAQAAGARVGDTMIGIGDVSASSGDWASAFRKAYATKEGARTTLYLLRDGKPVTIDLKITFTDAWSWRMERIKNPAKEQTTLLDAWLAGK